MPVAGTRLTHRAVYLLDASGPVHVIAVRGTASREDVLIDLGIQREIDPRLGAGVHAGFRRVAEAVQANLLAHRRLDPRKPVVVTGHSLGRAVALLLGLDLDAGGTERFRVQAIYTFGQPKVLGNGGVTASPGLQRLVFRVVTCGDPVPILPVSQSHLAHFGRLDGWSRSRLDDNQHLGSSLLLLPEGRHWLPGPVELDRDIRGTALAALTDMLRRLPAEHAMEVYLRRLAALSSPSLAAPGPDAARCYLGAAGPADAARAVAFAPDGRVPCALPALPLPASLAASQGGDAAGTSGP